MEERIKQLENEVQQLKAALTLSGMPYDLKEIIRNEVIEGESPLQTLTQTYTVSGGNIIGPKGYAGTIILKSKGKQYIIPRL